MMRSANRTRAFGVAAMVLFALAACAFVVQFWSPHSAADVDNAMHGLGSASSTSSTAVAAPRATPAPADIPLLPQHRVGRRPVPEVAPPAPSSTINAAAEAIAEDSRVATVASSEPVLAATEKISVLPEPGKTYSAFDVDVTPPQVVRRRSGLPRIA